MSRSTAPRAGRRRGGAAVVLSPLARQIAALGLALCAVALSLAYPVRQYLEQQVAERQAVAEQQQLEDEIADLHAQQAALSDPAYIKAEAKRRLQYVSPGDTVYVVKVPGASSGVPPSTTVDPRSATADGPGAAQQTTGDTGAAPDEADAAGDDADAGDDAAGQPWYESLWDTVSGDGDTVIPGQ